MIRRIRWGLGMLAALTALAGTGPAFAQALCDSDPGGRPLVDVSSDITMDTVWDNDHTYILSDVIYVRNGANLTIEKGTIVRGRPDANTAGANNPGALVIARDSKIFALGEAREPIVFTDCYNDNVLDTRPGTFPYDDLSNALAETANWGGLILLGRGYVSNNTAAGADPSREVLIEGLEANGECSNNPAISCTSDPDCGGGTCEGIGRGFYGNCSAVYNTGADPCACDDDDSGVLNYVSVSFGGFNLSPDNEINGITLGAVGRETDLEYLEVFQSKDDCMEFFGGAPEVKHLVCANLGDDGFDTDEGTRVKGQFIFEMQGKPGTDKGDKGGEHDGGNSPDSSRPLAMPTVYNATYIGLGQGGTTTNTTVHFRDNAGFRYYNSAFLDFAGAAALVEGGSDSTYPRDLAQGTAANTAGERSITNFPPANGDDACFYSSIPSSTKQLEMRDDLWWCIGRQEANSGEFAGTLPTLGYCSDDVSMTRNCTQNSDCTSNDCVDSPLEDWGVTSTDTSKVHYDPGWLAGSYPNSFGNTYLGCGAALPIRTLTRDMALGYQTVSVDPLPAAGSPLLTSPRTAPNDGFFDPVSYKGAFYDENWAAGWTQLWRFGYFADNTCSAGVCSDARQTVDSDITTDTHWTADKVWVLADVIYVRNGATLTIDPGTVIRGLPDAETTGSDNPGALVITRDSKILANGTAGHPIIFTDKNNDNIHNFGGTYPYSRPEDALGEVANWGGLILLGRGYVSNNTSGGADPSREVLIEGLVADGECSNNPAISCTSDTDCTGGTCEGIGRGFYGNCSAVYNTGADPCVCDDDDSGVLNYVSVSFGGFNLSPDNEINGITLGAVGRETDLDHLEVFQSKDDCMEFFGGAPQLKHLACMNLGDDGFDTDEGTRVKGQFILEVQGKPGTDKGDKGGEHDGGNSPDSSRPLAEPTVANATYIGLGQGGTTTNTTVHFRDNAGFRYYNSAFLDFAGAAALVEGGSDSTYPRDLAQGTAANTAGERSITNFPPTGDDGCFYSQIPSSAKQLEIRNSTWWCIGRQENSAWAGTLPTLGYCSDDVSMTRNCTQNSDCTSNDCVDSPLEDWGVTSTDTSKVHYDPGWLAGSYPNSFQNAYLACGAALPIRTLDRDAALGYQTISVDPRPAAGSPLLSTNLTKVADPFFEKAQYRGAFSTHNWVTDWTQMWRTRYVTECGFGGSGNTTPDEVVTLSTFGKNELRWTHVHDAKTYEALRSTDPSSFASATSVETGSANVHDRKADISTDSPSVGQVYGYLVRAVNDCGDGTVGTNSSGVERAAP